MTELLDPGLDENHPRTLYHQNLVRGESITWHSETATTDVLLDYILGLLDLGRGQLQSTPAGFLQPRDESLLMTLLRGPRGVCLTVWAFDGGSQRVNAAIEREWNTMREELSRGEYMGNAADARWTPVVGGRIRSDFEGSDLFDFINGAEVVSVPGIEPTKPPAAAPALDSDPWDDAKVVRYLEADSDVLEWEAIKDTMFRVRVRIAGMDGAQGIPMFVSTGLNDLMLIIIATVDADRVGAAIQATADIGVVGVTTLGEDSYALRYGAFKEGADMMSLVNGLQAVAIAYGRYLAA